MEHHWAAAEMSGAQVWDKRCLSSLAGIYHRLVLCSGLSFSAALGPALRQAAHRIFESAQTSVSGLLKGHRGETLSRCQPYSLILVVQDTTEIDYTGHTAKTGLGPLGSMHTQGLLAHGALAVSPTGVPLGVVDLAIWVRDPAQFGKRHTCDHRPTCAKESRKWIDALIRCEEVFPPEQPILLIQDREAEIFSFLATPRRPNTHLLVRAGRPRMVEIPGSGDRVMLKDAIAQSPVIGTMDVTIPRKPDQNEHVATLALRVREVIAQPPSNQVPGEPDQPQTVWVVQATEVTTSNEKTEVATSNEKTVISWTLLSTLPVTNLDQARQMVVYYTRRWVIERLHYTLKSGCRVEQLQIDDAHSLSNALAIYYMVAWRLLYLTHIARDSPEMPASELMPPVELVVLKHTSKTEIVTVAQAILAIAKMGGYEHYKNAKPPGVKALWTGVRHLEAMAEGWLLALNSIGQDRQ